MVRSSAHEPSIVRKEKERKKSLSLSLFNLETIPRLEKRRFKRMRKKKKRVMTVCLSDSVDPSRAKKEERERRRKSLFPWSHWPT